MKTYLELFLIFLKLGTFTLGGGYAMIPLIHNEIVENKNWIDSKDFMEMLAVVQSSPGALAINTAVFIGYKIKGILGIICTTFGVLTPSVIIIWILARFLKNFNDNYYVINAFKGIRPMIVALIFYSVYKIIKSNNIKKIGIVLITFFSIFIAYFKIQPIFLILVGIIFGNLLEKYKGRKQ